MKKVLENYPCYVEIGPVGVETRGNKEDWPLPRLPILDGAIAFDSSKVKVRCLLDTGCDITIVNRKKIQELNNELKAHSKVVVIQKRGIEFHRSSGGNESSELQPSFELEFIFPENHFTYSSEYGFIVPEVWDYDEDLDVLLGQDIFNQLEVTFNGVNGTVTIIDPNDE